MARRLQPTFADYIVIALSPVLIMLLVGSLVFFLLEVFYRGDYNSRLTFIMAMFVMASVLIARISIEESRGYAMLFAFPLAGVTAIALYRFVEFGGPLESFSMMINLGLIGLILWCADRLTWDSTVIDESKDASGEGLLQTAGLDADATTQNAAHEVAAATQQPQATLFQRLMAYRRRPHSPGVWVIYFSIAALPIFGFGHWFIPAESLESRRYVFKLLVVYVAAGLGLLLTTSFLNLRRYLRQRRLEMPFEMAGTWIGTGAAMIAALLVVCMLLPRRNPEYSITQLPIFAGSPTDLWTTEYAVGNEGQEDPEKGDRQGEQESEDGMPDDNVDDKSENPFQDPKSKNDRPTGAPSSGQGKSDGATDEKGPPPKQGPSGEKKKGQPATDSKSGTKPTDTDDPSGKPQDKNSPGKSGEKKNESGKQNPSEPIDGKQPPKETPQDRAAPDDRGDQSNSDPKEKPKSEKKGGPSSKKAKSSTQSQPQPKSKFDPSKITSALGGTIGQLLKLLYWVVAIGIIAYFTWKYWKQVLEALSNFWKSLQNFWASLLGRQPTAEGEQLAAAPVAPPPKTFGAFHDPFLTGMAQNRPPAEVIRYSFEALEAWAREQGFPRPPEQTPQEFALVVGAHQTAVARDAATLAELYNRCAYSPDLGPRSNIEPLRRLWQQMRDIRAPQFDESATV